MQAEFWHDKWEKGQIGFHEGQANEALVKHWSALEIESGATVFVPLCGKTKDIAWFLSQGLKVVGAELNSLAVEQLFSELGVKPNIKQVGEFKRYQYQDLTVYQGDFFQLDSTTLGQVDVIYDRAALVALPEAMRQQYVKHLQAISLNAQQFLISFDYPQQRMAGPPFAVSAAMVNEYYQGSYQINALEQGIIPLGLKGKVDINQTVFWLK
ncbi:thiopurine S-methyltransferase [Paraferrimonas sp. SM1919]|uniref:thiopurine S-methyltransferase n=1 Tax=Paraferrimonas sp. SM1919 TaxID=2662263 RepID=UPI0013D66A30|nr:thiopurine S-methyltransferase [Paraferrimonas sp. SM1919]